MVQADRTIHKFRGIIPAVVSPHDGLDKFSVDPFVQQIEFLYSQGIHGIYVCGGTGEGYSLRIEERKKVLETCLAVSRGRGLVIDHVGAQNSRDAAELAEHAAELGADAIASIPPLARSGKELEAYYGDLARASSLPLFIYYIPAITGRTMSIDEILRLLDVEGVIGMKFTDTNLFLLRRLLDARPATVVFSGCDEVLFPALLYGAAGGIGTWYNVVPRAFLGVFNAVACGDCEAAWIWQHRIIRLADVGWRFGIKATVELLLRRQGRVIHAFRRPHLPLDRPEEEELVAILSAIAAELQWPDLLGFKAGELLEFGASSTRHKENPHEHPKA